MTVTEMIREERPIPPKMYAEYYGVRAETVYRNIKRGLIQAERVGGRLFVIPRPRRESEGK